MGITDLGQDVFVKLRHETLRVDIDKVTVFQISTDEVVMELPEMLAITGLKLHPTCKREPLYMQGVGYL
jgi:hypothetical protein